MYLAIAARNPRTAVALLSEGGTTCVTATPLA
jgi:hypothetical protein